jgi:hypothetical protein
LPVTLHLSRGAGEVGLATLGFIPRGGEPGEGGVREASEPGEGGR